MQHGAMEWPQKYCYDRDAVELLSQRRDERCQTASAGAECIGFIDVHPPSLQCLSASRPGQANLASRLRSSLGRWFGEEERRYGMQRSGSREDGVVQVQHWRINVACRCPRHVIRRKQGRSSTFLTAAKVQVVPGTKWGRLSAGIRPRCRGLRTPCGVQGHLAGFGDTVRGRDYD